MRDVVRHIFGKRIECDYGRELVFQTWVRPPGRANPQRYAVREILCAVFRRQIELIDPDGLLA